MTLKVRCDQCGKVSQFSGSDAGMVALCVACGARFTIPAGAAGAAGAVAPPGGAAAEGSLPAMADTVVAVVPPMEMATTAALPAVAPPRSSSADTIDVPAELGGGGGGPNYALLYTLLGSAMTIAIVLAAVAVLSTQPTWEDRNRVALRDLKTKAEALAAGHKVQEAYDAYRRIDELVAGHEIQDDKLRAELAKARAERDGLFAQLSALAKEQQATAAPPISQPAPAKAPTPSATKPATVVVTAEQPPVAQTWPEYIPKPLYPRPPVPAATTQAGAAEARPVQAAALPQTRPADVNPLGAATSPAPADPARPPITVTRRAQAPSPGVTDEAIGRAIQRAVDGLIPQFQDGKLGGGANRNDAYYTGLNALTVYALLQSSLAIKDERLNPKGPLVRDLINKMKQMPADTGPATYARGIRATALALLARQEDRIALAQDVKYLLDSHVGGAYTYSAAGRGASSSDRRAMMMNGRWDNSNSQYGLLGVWSGAEIGMEVNSTYWQAVENHWARCQFDDGSWGYSGYVGRGGGGGGQLSMTLAGCASLFVTHDYLDAPKIGAQVGREPFSKALAKGLAYLETGDNAVRINGGYTLYGLERVGLASGFKFFGDHDWYRELAGEVVRGQDQLGGWGGEVETAYHLLFLARGRHPVLMNKLRYDGSWANRPRDVANLARFGSKELERPLNWQVVPITRDWTDWTDSPILYIGAHAPARFTDEDLAKIRSFVFAGGLLFTQADGGRPEASEWAEELAKKLFAPYEMKDLSDDHELFHLLYNPSPHPKLRGVSNGARLLMVHSPTDITQHWQTRQDKSRRSLFELGMNLYLYAAGKGDMRNRLTSAVIPPQGPAGGGSVRVARVRYGGNWDPEPFAWTRFARYFQRETDVAVNVAAVDLDKLDASVCAFAHWTGTDAYAPTAAELAAIRRFVEAGGVLFVDPCGGSGEFYESVKQALLAAFPQARGQVIPRTHPLFAAATAAGMDDLPAALVRGYVKAKGFGAGGRLDQLTAGKGRVVYNTLDVTNGLLGCNTWGVLGFDPGYASALMKNVLIWSVSGMKDQ